MARSIARKAHASNGIERLVRQIEMTFEPLRRSPRFGSPLPTTDSTARRRIIGIESGVMQIVSGDDVSKIREVVGRDWRTREERSDEGQKGRSSFGGLAELTSVSLR